MPHYSPVSTGGLLNSMRGGKHGQAKERSSPSPSRSNSATMDFIKHQIHGKDKEKRKSMSEDMLKSRAARLEICIESPPLVSYGTMENSTGALMSGQLRLHVTDQPIKIEKYELELVAKVRYARPVSKDCPECQVTTNELKRWKIIQEPKTFEKGTHGAPFSYLLDGHLPATTNSVLGSVDYVLIATAVTATQEKMTTSHVLDLKRSIQPPELDRAAVRVFPPTNLRAEIQYPPVVHPIGEFNVQLSLSGIVNRDRDLLRRWRLRRVLWRIEECSKLVSKPCTKHAAKVGGEGKGVEHVDTRVIGSSEIKDGWKSDWAVEGGGSTMVEFPCAVSAKTKAVCDMANPAGMSVQHRITLELIVVEEVANFKHVGVWNATGSARVLRMAFTVYVTERAGMGISWDEEQPPLYEEVPASPPGYNYAKIEDFDPAELGDDLPRRDTPQPQQGESSTSQASQI